MNSRKTFAARTSVRAIAAAAALLAAGTASAQADRTPVNSNLPPGALPSSWDPTYNVCRGVDPKCYRNWVGNRQDKVLIFSRTAGPRHANIGSRLPAGKQTQANASATPSTNITLDPASHTAQVALRAWLNAEGIAVDVTEDVSQLGGLNSYKAVIFLSNSRDALWKHAVQTEANAVNTSTSAYLDSAKVDLRKYMKAGGGFVAIHNAFGTEYNWPWYEGLLGNANYYDHGANQNGTVRIRGSADASTAGVPATFGFRDEWYSLSPYPTNVKFLATVESLANPGGTHPGHGAHHPVAWCQYYDGGRAWLTTLGHDRAAFQDGSGFPGQQEFKKLLVQGIKSAMGLTEFCTR